MKNSLHPLVCAASIIFSLTACEKQKENHQSNKSAPTKPDISSNTLAAEMTKSVLSKKEFDDPADGYFHGYLLTREAKKSTNQEESIRNLEEALGYFRAVKKKHPDWKPAMVDARTQLTEESLDRLAKNGH